MAMQQLAVAHLSPCRLCKIRVLLPKVCFVFILPPSVPIVGIKSPITPLDLVVRSCKYKEKSRDSGKNIVKAI
jgi:hypothetical protein